MAAAIDFKVGPIKSIKLDPRPRHAMGPVINVEVSHVLGTSHGLMTPGQAQQLGLALIQAGREALGDGVRCHNADACQAGQRAYPTPHACGVKP